MDPDITAVHRALAHLPREQRAPAVTRAWAAMALAEARRHGLQVERIIASPLRSISVVFGAAGPGATPRRALIHFDEEGGIWAVVGAELGGRGGWAWQVERSGLALRDCINDILCHCRAVV